MHNDDDDKSCKTENRVENGSLVKIVDLEAKSFNFFLITYSFDVFIKQFIYLYKQ